MAAKGQRGGGGVEGAAGGAEDSVRGAKCAKRQRKRLQGRGHSERFIKLKPRKYKIIQLKTEVSRWR